MAASKSFNNKVMFLLFMIISGSVFLLISLPFSYIPAVRTVYSLDQRQKSQKDKFSCTEQQLIEFTRCKESFTIQHRICSFCGDVQILFLSELGQGSNANVYSVHISEDDPNMNLTPYVIKMSWNHEYCERLQKEYHILSTLTNQHIPKLHPQFMYYQWLWPKTGNINCLIVMQQIPNTITLNTLINSKSRVYRSYFTSAQLDFNSILRVILQCYHNIQSALHECHSQYIYHLDHKLLNILFDTSTFQCYLIDFGRSMRMNDFEDIKNNQLEFSYLETGTPKPYDYLKLTVSKRDSSWGTQAALKQLQRYGALSNMYKLANEFMRVIMYFYWRLPPKEIGCNLYHYKLNELNLRLMYKVPLMSLRRNRLGRVLCRRKHQIQYLKRSITYQLEQNRTVLDRNVLGRLYRDILDVIDHGLTWFPSTLCKGADARDHKLDAIKDISFQTIYSNQTYVVNEKGNCA